MMVLMKCKEMDLIKLLYKDRFQARKGQVKYGHEVKHDHKWVNIAKKEGFSQDYLIDTFVGIW